MAAFGRSVEDIIQGIKAVTALCHAFSSTKGAETHYVETLGFLRELQATLECIEQHVAGADGDLSGKYPPHIRGILETIGPPFKKFIKYVEGYKPVLGVNSRNSTNGMARKDVLWGVERLDVLSEKTAELKDAIASPLSLVVSLIVLQATEDFRSHITPNGVPCSIIHVFHETDLVHGLQSAIEDLKASMKMHEKGLQLQMNSERYLPMTLQPENQEAPDVFQSKNTPDRTRPLDKDARMVIAIEMLRHELKQSTESILEILGDSDRAPSANGYVRSELELYRRAFKTLRQSLENSWSTLKEVDYLIEKRKKSKEVTNQTSYPYFSHDNTIISVLTGFFDSATATTVSKFFTLRETCGEKSGSGGTTGHSDQFSSAFSSLTYAYLCSTPPLLLADQKSSLENISKSAEKSNAPLPPEPAQTFDQVFGSSFNGTTANAPRPSIPDTSPPPYSESIGPMPSSTTTTTAPPQYNLSGSFDSHSFINPTNSFSSPGNFSMSRSYFHRAFHLRRQM